MASSKDLVIMGTNSYSIVSKRSVEHLYYAKGSQFLAEFVPQVKRRSPLINRGYWVRMRAIEDSVAGFLGAQSTGCDPAQPASEAQTQQRPKIVVNLGCGEDTLPLRMLETLHRDSNSKVSNQQVLFVDVDYADLMEAKANRILSSDLLRKTLSIADSSAVRSHASILLRTSNYAAVAADLNKLDSVTRQLDAVLLEYYGCATGAFTGDILFIAEVSITYMPTPAADALLAWAAYVVPHGTATFTVLEQILPAGQDHPFAQTMLAHFNKSAPLQSVTEYPTLNHQHERFTKAGWPLVSSRTLWDIWENLDDTVRRDFDAVEPFDEWEEFALFCSHYIFLTASTGHHSGRATSPSHTQSVLSKSGAIGDVVYHGRQLPAKCVKGKARRFAAAMSFRDLDTSPKILHAGGYDSDNRLSGDTDVSEQPHIAFSTVSPTIQDVRIIEASQMHEILLANDPRPVVLRKQDLGSCTSSWSASKLSELVGQDRPITIHESETHSLSFTTKNFSYATVPFASLIDRAVAGKHVYLRALADGKDASTKPASLQRDFPTIAADFRLPAELLSMIHGELVHSSVLRVAGNIDMWLHYDVMANVLCQVRGQKRVVLFPPDDVLRLGFAHGSTTSGTNVFEPSGHLGTDCGPFARTSRAQHHTDITSTSSSAGQLKLPAALVCFSITPLQTRSTSHVLIGGRTSPRKASGACWSLEKQTTGDIDRFNWKPIAPLEPGRFRHSAASVKIGGTDGVLVFGGKTSDGKVLDSWHLYLPSVSKSWIAPVIAPGAMPVARFGHAMCTTRSEAGRSTGILVGGMDENHRLLKDVWRWNIVMEDGPSPQPVLTFSKCKQSAMYARFGAVLTPCSGNGSALLIGGVGPAGVLQSDEEIIHIPTDLRSASTQMSVGAWTSERPLLVGHSALYESGKVYILGGGAVCFSFGSHWNKSTTVLEAFHTTIDGQEDTDSTREPLGLHPQAVTLYPGDCLFIPACWLHATAPGHTGAGAQGEDGHMSVAVNVFFKSLQKGYAAGRDVYGNRDLDCYQNGRRDVQKISSLLREWEESNKTEICDKLAAVLRGECSEKDLSQSLPGMKEVLRIKRSVQVLPTQLQRFYVLRLAAEIEDLSQG